MNNQPTFKATLEKYQTRIEQVLERYLPAAQTHPVRLHQAMRYSTLDGGKRIRPVLVYATGETLGTNLDQLDAPAAAVELIHAYSLVHDDLPSMDDDDLRRGKPTCHKAFDEATAVLVGDGLQALAFHVLAHGSEPEADAKLRLKMIEQLAVASGSRGMVGGQAIDLDSVGQTLNVVQLEDMHIHKTGALIRASVLLGAYASNGVSAERLEKLDRYAKCIGLAFQIRDDILDIEGNTQEIGKTQGADAVRNKPTYPSIIGLEAAKERAELLHEEAIGSLAGFGDAAETLRQLSQFIVARKN